MRWRRRLRMATTSRSAASVRSGSRIASRASRAIRAPAKLYPFPRGACPSSKCRRNSKTWCRSSNALAPRANRTRFRHGRAPREPGRFACGDVAATPSWPATCCVTPRQRGDGFAEMPRRGNARAMSRTYAAGIPQVRPQLVIWILAAVCLLRVAAAFLPTGYVWGVSFAHDVTPALAWPLVLLMCASVAAAFGWRARVQAEPRTAFAAAWPFALGTVLALLLACVPDRQHFVGDFVIRLGILESRHGFERIFPQALPLDRALNHLLPIEIGGRLHLEPALVLRGLGLFEAVMLVALAVRFARRVASTEVAAFSVAAVLCFGGYATLLTGDSKPTTQGILCAIAVGTLGWEWVVLGTGGRWLALATAVGVAVHRGGLPLIVPFAVAHLLAWRHAVNDSRRARLARIAGMLLPFAVLAWEAPRLAAVIRSFDVPVNFAPEEVRQRGGMWLAAFSPLRLRGDVNALLFHAPLAPLALLALAGGWRDRQPVFFTSLAAAFLPVLLFVFLPLGPFRDYDSLGGAGASVAVISAWAIARVPDGRAPGGARALAIAVPASVVVPFLRVLFSLADLDRGFARARALASGPPRRSATQRASLLDWVGLRALNEERYDVAHEAFRDLCRETPIQHALKLWGASSLLVGQPGEAREAFTQLLAGSAADPVGCYGLWMSAKLSGDTLLERRAEVQVGQWRDDGPEMRTVVDFLDHYPQLYALVGRSRAPAP